jgi:phenylalanyl-tRNA synthetase alpha chain
MTNLTGRMDDKERLEELRRDVPEKVAATDTLEELADLEAAAVGKQSVVAAARRSLGSIDPEKRREYGRFINEVASEISAAIDTRRAALEAAAEAAQLEQDRVDVTLPGRRPRRGSHHLVQEVMDEIVDIFISLGYTVATGPEAETEYYNFTALNFPHAHPTRLDTDTFYLDYGDVPEGVLLRTHTSPMQARYMEQNDPPVYVVVPGRCCRRDQTDPTHTPVFHQVEGLAVDENITFGDLKGTLAHFAREFFGPDTKVKFLPHFFPFTEPSAEMHASCFACAGRGCRICSHTGWIEMLGCGMVHPAVFEHVGYDPEAVTGFAFGMGADRFAMVRHGLTDLRHFWVNDLRVLGQFR